MQRKKLISLGVMGMLTMPLISLVACGQNFNYERGEGNDISYIEKGFINDVSKHKNVLSSFYNSTDMLAALGYYPDYASPLQGTAYSDYLKPFLGTNNVFNTSSKAASTGKVTIKEAPEIMDGKVVDREAILKADISTILLNEWELPDEHKFLGITPAIIYTSMADGHARYTDEDFYQGALGENITTTWGLNTFEAFEMLAKGLDRAYADHNFLQTAQSINQQVAANIKILHDSLNIENRSIMVLELKQESGALKIELARSPGVYSVLYSKNDQRGLGYDFPKAANRNSESDLIKNISATDFAVKGSDTSSFTTEFNQAVDEIIVLENPQGTSWDDNKVVTLVQSMLKTSSTTNDIHILNSDEFYDSVWGIYGLNKFLSNFNTEFNNDAATLKAIPELANDRTFEKLR